jgi:hypothetical protein
MYKYLMHKMDIYPMKILRNDYNQNVYHIYDDDIVFFAKVCKCNGDGSFRVEHIYKNTWSDKGCTRGDQPFKKPFPCLPGDIFEYVTMGGTSMEDSHYWIEYIHDATGLCLRFNDTDMFDVFDDDIYFI